MSQGNNPGNPKNSPSKTAKYKWHTQVSLANKLRRMLKHLKYNPKDLQLKARLEKR